MNNYRQEYDEQRLHEKRTTNTVDNEEEEEEEEEEDDDDDDQYGRNRGGRKQIKLGTNRRNARERNRVRHLNACFEILRQHIPHEKHQKKLSKVDTLKSAMIYIENLRQLLENSSQSSSYLNSSENCKSFFPIDIKREEYSYWSDHQRH